MPFVRYEILPGMRYKKYFTTKAWNKFDLTAQDILCGRYDIILTDHETKSEKVKRILKKFNLKNLNKGIDKVNKGMAQFSEMIAEEKPKRTRRTKTRTRKEPRRAVDNFNSSWGSDKERNDYIKKLLG